MLLAILVLQVIFNIQLTLSLHRQKNNIQPHTPFPGSVLNMGKVSSSYFEFYFVTFKLCSPWILWKHTNKGNQTGSPLFFILLLSAGNLAPKVQQNLSHSESLGNSSFQKPSFGNPWRQTPLSPETRLFNYSELKHSENVLGIPCMLNWVGYFLISQKHFNTNHLFSYYLNVLRFNREM